MALLKTFRTCNLDLTKIPNGFALVVLSALCVSMPTCRTLGLIIQPETFQAVFSARTKWERLSPLRTPEATFGQSHVSYVKTWKTCMNKTPRILQNILKAWNLCAYPAKHSLLASSIACLFRPASAAVEASGKGRWFRFHIVIDSEYKGVV